MVDVNDPQRFGPKLENELENLRESPVVDTATYKAVKKWVKAQESGRVPDDESLSTSTVLNYTRHIRYAAEELDTSLLEATTDQLNDYLEERSYQYSAGYHNSSVWALQQLSEFHELGWVGDLNVVTIDEPSIDTNRVYTSSEVVDLKEAGDLRDKVMVGLFADAGPRVGALCSFRIRDLDLDGPVPQLKFNPDAPTKSADGKLLLTWSKGHIETYLANEHPYPKTPNAPLLFKQMHHNSDDPEDGAICPQTVRDRLKRLGEKVGISRDRMKPHNFRHTAVSNWIRQGYKPQDIVQRAKWSSSAPLDYYDNVTDEQKNEDIARRLGLIDEDEVEREPGEYTFPCPRCSTPVHHEANYCASCSLALTEEAVKEEHANKSPAPSTGEAEPKVPEDVWSDGAGDVLDEVPTDALLRKLLEREDINASDLLDE